MAKDEVREDAQLALGGLKFVIKQVKELVSTGTEQTQTLGDALWHLKNAEAELITFISQRLSK
jgi:hypothetical protein